MMGEFVPQGQSKKGFQRSIPILRSASRPRVSLYIKATIVIVGALMALAI